MYAEISAAISSAKTLAELLKAAQSLHNYNDFVAAVSDVNAKLMDATAVALESQERHAELLARVAELEKELLDIQQVKDVSLSYALHKFETGSLAYRFLGSDRDVPDHFLCAKCLDAGQHSKLQPWGSHNLKCNTCDSKIQHRFAPAPTQAPRRIIGSGFNRDW